MRKRFISLFALLLAVVLLTGISGVASAYNDEITWQEIPWYSSMEEVKTLLTELYGEFDVDQVNGSRGFILNSDGDTFGDWVSYESQTVSLLVQPKDAEILGYPLDRIRFVFAVNGEDSKLITVALAPKAPDPSGKAFDTMVGTFVDEIIGQYGTPQKNNSSQLILCGGENTAIYMYKDMDDFLWYGKTDAGALLEAEKGQ